VKSSRNLLWALLFVTLLLAFTAQPVQAQSEGTIQGTVLDAQGATVAGAKVTVRNLATGLERSDVTDTSGIFSFPALPAGNYRIEIRKDGFQTLAIGSFTLDVATVAAKNYTLQVGQVAETMEVTTEAPVVEAATMTVGQSIDRKTVQEIPLNGRHFVDLGLLIPGSVTPPQNGFLTAPLRGQGSFAFNTAGNREDTVNFMINGINLNDMVQNQITFQPSINTVSEFKVDNSTFSAEYGRNSGAIVNIATRSGANNYHGELFEFLRNHDFDARNLFNLSPTLQSPFKRNQFGANFGGPLRKDKAFFFASYEGLRQRQGITVLTPVPTDAQRATATDPTVVKLLTSIPHANATDSTGALNRFSGSATAPVDIDQGTIDLSYNLTQSDVLHGYYAHQHDLRQEPTLQGNNLPGWGDTRESHRQIMTLNYDHIFGPKLTNQARLGFNRLHITFTPNQQLNPADFGINNGITQAIGLPQIGVTGGLNIGGPNGFPSGRGDTTAVFSDTLNWLKGRNSIALGGEARRFYNNNINESIGSFTFSSLTNFLSDRAQRFTVLQGSGNDKILEPAWGIFAQDNFKLAGNFTLELGLRYDWNSTPTESQNRFTVFVPATDSLVRVGTSGLGQVYGTNNQNVQPRVGFAWDPFKDGKTSVRAGYAILADQPVTNAVTNLSANPPFALPVTVNSATNSITFANANTFSAGSVSPATVNPDFKNAYVQSWNLNVQRAFTPTLGLTVGYFGSKGTHLRIARNINQGTPFSTLSASSPISPGAALGNITDVDSGGNSIYNALWVTGRKHFSRNFEFNASYTYSHSIDYNSLSSQGVVVQDSFNIRNDRGSSDFDARHRFVVNALYALPFKANRWVEGWQLGVISQAQSGNPLTFLVNNTAFTGNRTLRPNLTGPVQIAGTVAQWIANPAVLVPASPTGFGNLGRNAIIGPTFVNTDFSVLKDTRLTERFKLQLRAESFDLFNHPNLGNPGTILGTSTFNQVTSTRFPTGDFGSARQLQFAMKLMF
jgi:outer membrane receptor protein involved in Fe transport